MQSDGNGRKKTISAVDGDRTNEQLWSQKSHQHRRSAKAAANVVMAFPILNFEKVLQNSNKVEPSLKAKTVRIQKVSGFI